MKSTKAKLIITDLINKGDKGDFYEVVFKTELHREDFEILRELTRWLNGRATLAGDPIQDEADLLMGLLTEGLHRYKEIKDGKPFDLRMDRKPKDPNKA